MKRNLIYLTSGIALFTGSLFAGTMGAIDNIYLRADLGYNFFNDPSAITASYLSNTKINALDTHVENRLGYNVGIGYRFIPQLRADLTFTYRPSISFEATDDAPEVGTANLRNYTLMVNGYYDIDFNFPVIPYIMGGIGLSSNSTDNIYWPFVQQSEYGHTVNYFAWQVGAGLAYAFNANLLVDFNYQFVDLGKFSNTGNYNTGGPFNLGLTGTPTSFDTLYSNQIQLGLRYYI
ncbi:outer membrane beta-barrel protein [Fluoribacter dumoffii]|uniref:outer membrane protein n=1 Tax=Fluoribacter dumoffii TaxID=463 RepID=UPI00026C8208|nr:outer membrane beta-barrel protein [Fluoribacter dumoffii]MCW8385474.1 outer membrane beta-barrel protein [Fluoribacter dumoffii]MCW8496230.1 outer membrane beta-barrel protein [Fluoribacter dumoffii]